MLVLLLLVQLLLLPAALLLQSLRVPQLLEVLRACLPPAKRAWRAAWTY